MTQPSGVLGARRFVVQVRHDGVARNICQVQLEPFLGFYVHLPYFAHRKGLVGRYEVDEPPGGSRQVRLDVGGHVTGQRLKYAHHRDGEAHFSQDGRVYTRVRNRSAPLDDHVGHVFTVVARGFHDFAPPKPKDAGPFRPDRSVVCFDLPNPVTTPFRLVGRWSHRRMMWGLPRSSSQASRITPMSFENDDGSRYQAFVLSTPEDEPGSDARLILSCHPAPDVVVDGDSVCLLIGGFGAAARAGDEGASFISVQYAERDHGFAELEALLGTIDRGPLGQ